MGLLKSLSQGLMDSGRGIRIQNKVWDDVSQSSLLLSLSHAASLRASPAWNPFSSSIPARDSSFPPWKLPREFDEVPPLNCHSHLHIRGRSQFPPSAVAPCVLSSTPFSTSRAESMQDLSLSC